LWYAVFVRKVDSWSDLFASQNDLSAAWSNISIQSSYVIGSPEGGGKLKDELAVVGCDSPEGGGKEELAVGGCDSPDSASAEGGGTKELAVAGGKEGLAPRPSCAGLPLAVVGVGCDSPDSEGKKELSVAGCDSPAATDEVPPWGEDEVPPWGEDEDEEVP
jgi:hypothetical protein